MKEIWNKFRRWVRRLIVTIRRKLREIEEKLDERQPHPAIGFAVTFLGIVVFLAGVAMMVLPGPGMITIALGIAFVIIGFKIAQGAYGPDRKAAEMEAKRKRLEERRQQKAAAEAEKSFEEEQDINEEKADTADDN